MERSVGSCLQTAVDRRCGQAMGEGAATRSRQSVQRAAHSTTSESLSDPLVLSAASAAAAAAAAAALAAAAGAGGPFSSSPNNAASPSADAAAPPPPPLESALALAVAKTSERSVKGMDRHRDKSVNSRGRPTKGSEQVIERQRKVAEKQCCGHTCSGNTRHRQ